MDPVSAIGFVSAIAGIVDLIAKGLLSLSDFQSRYRIADLKVSLLIGQLSTLKAALVQVGHLVEDVARVPRDVQLVSDLSISLLSLNTIIGALDNRLSHLQRTAEDGLSNWGRVGFVWDEQTMRDYLSLLDHQVNALGLLLTALQWFVPVIYILDEHIYPKPSTQTTDGKLDYSRTTFEQSDMLRALESRHIFDLARDETSSLRWLTDSESIGTLRSAGTQDLETVHARFDFDSEVFTSRAYRVATRANMISALTGSRRRGISHTTDITAAGPALAVEGDAPGLNEDVNQPTRAGIALTTIVDVVSVRDAASDTQSDVSEDTVTEPQASTTSLIRANYPDAQLPDFVIHTPETLGLLAIQIGELSKNKPVSPLTVTDSLRGAKRKTLGRFFKPSAQLPILLRPKQQVAAPGMVQSIHAYKPVKILILGISGSGKSTLAKAMRAGHGDIDESWLRLYRDTIIDNTKESLKWLMCAAEEIRAEINLWRQVGSWDAEAFSARARILDPLWTDGLLASSREVEAISSAAKYLWNHPCIRQIFEQKLPVETYLPDCPDYAGYFLNSIERIFDKDYLPSLEDATWAHAQTTGTWESKFLINGTTYRIFDVGGARSERKKWVHVFESVNMLVFTLDVSCYHQVLEEDHETNRMSEQFVLWDSIANSRWFSSARIAVLFTKEDKLTPDRLRKHPFGEMDRDYHGDPESVEDIIKYLTWRLDGLLNRELHASTGRDGSGRVTFCRGGTISESMKVWETLLAVR